MRNHMVKAALVCALFALPVAAIVAGTITVQESNGVGMGIRSQAQGSPGTVARLVAVSATETHYGPVVTFTEDMPTTWSVIGGLPSTESTYEVYWQYGDEAENLFAATSPVDVTTKNVFCLIAGDWSRAEADLILDEVYPVFLSLSPEDQVAMMTAIAGGVNAALEHRAETLGATANQERNRLLTGGVFAE